MSNRLVTYLDETHLGPTRRLWRHCPIDTYRQDPGKGQVFEEYSWAGGSFPTNAAVGAGGFGPWNLHADIAGTITQVLDEVPPAVQINPGDTDEDEVYLTGPKAFVIDNDTAGNARELWFEARWKVAVITDADQGNFVGLGEAPAGADLLLDAATVLSDHGYVGFWRGDADGDSIDFVVNATGQAQTEILAAAHVPVADTYVTTGFHYNPRAPAAERISIWINGSPLTTFVTLAQINAATFPEAVNMGPALLSKNSDADNLWSVSWVRCAQEARRTP